MAKGSQVTLTIRKAALPPTRPDSRASSVMPSLLPRRSIHTAPAIAPIPTDDAMIEKPVTSSRKTEPASADSNSVSGRIIVPSANSSSSIGPMPGCLAP